MVNPYFCYALGFSTALLLYLAGWSDLYPSLSLSLIGFILITILAHVFLGIRFRKSDIGHFRTLPFRDDQAPWLVTFFLYCLWAAEFFYAGGIPLVKILFKQPYDYKLFGIPSFQMMYPFLLNAGIRRWPFLKRIFSLS